MSNQVDSPFGSYLKGLIGIGVGMTIFSAIFYWLFGEMLGMKGDIISVSFGFGAAFMLMKIGSDAWKAIFK